MADQSKKPDIWMPLYVADYQADTAYLTTEQHGAYLLMLMAYWRNGPIPDNDGIIAAITRQTPNAWSITRAVLEPMFQVSDGFWFHKRVEQEYDKAKKNRNTAHDRAANAARVRWERERMLRALPQALPEQCTSPSPSPSHTESTKERSSVDDSLDGRPSKPKVKSGKTTLATWLASCQASGDDPIPEGDPIFAWADSVQLPDDYLDLAWSVFKRDMIDKGKLQTDWRATFRTYVRKGYLKLWAIGPDGYFLTTVGKQEAMAHGQS